jgi:hypothetical protein
MSLEQWRRNGWLVSNDTTEAEIAQLIAVVDTLTSWRSLVRVQYRPLFGPRIFFLKPVFYWVCE